MKNNKIIRCLLLLTLSIIALASCKQDVIFYDIAQEIEYQEPIVEGNVFSMVPCNGSLFVQNNAIYTKAWADKKDANGRWKKVTFQNFNESVIKLASDSSHLYALAKANLTDSTGKVYVVSVSSDGTGTMQEVAANVIELYDNRVFGTNGSTTGRNAYFTDSNKAVKKLNGTNTAVTQTVSDVMGSSSSWIKTAASDGITDYFSSNDVFAVIRKNTTTYLYSNSNDDKKTITYKASTSSSWSSGGTTEANITVLTANGADQLLVGTYTGYETSAVGSDGKPATGVTPTSNAESAFGTRYVTGIWHYGDEGTLYAAVVDEAHSQYNKLWGYYASRPSWNYE